MLTKLFFLTRFPERSFVAILAIIEVYQHLFQRIPLPELKRSDPVHIPDSVVDQGLFG
jgi:hypothetical protein